MSRYETGVISNIPSDKLEAIAAVYGVHPSIFMDWSVSWPEDIYEDFRNARNDLERSQILKKHGVPLDLKTEASRLLRDNPSDTINQDPELTAYLEELRTRPEMRMLFSVAKGASKADVEKAVAIIEALRKTEG